MHSISWRRTDRKQTQGDPQVCASASKWIQWPTIRVSGRFCFISAWIRSICCVSAALVYTNKYQCGLRFDFGCTEWRGRPQESKEALLMLIISAWDWRTKRFLDAHWLISCVCAWCPVSAGRFYRISICKTAAAALDQKQSPQATCCIEQNQFSTPTGLRLERWQKRCPARVVKYSTNGHVI